MQNDKNERGPAQWTIQNERGPAQWTIQNERGPAQWTGKDHLLSADGLFFTKGDLWMKQKNQ